MAEKTLVQIAFKMPDLAQRLKISENRISKFLASLLQTNRGMMFDQEGAHNGKPKWAPLKYRDGQILSLTGTLRKSFAPPGMTGNAGPNGTVVIRGNLVSKAVTIGTTLKYAPLMNWGSKGLPGGVIRPKKGRVLAWRSGDKTIFASSVTVPARRMDLLNEADKYEMNVSLTNFVARILNGG